MNSKDKRVTILLSVFHNQDFPIAVSKKKLKYNTARSLNSGSIPLVVSEVLGGVIIKLDPNDIVAYLKKNISFENLLDDEILIDYLESYLMDIKSRRVRNQVAKQQVVDVVGLMDSPLFDNLDLNRRTQVHLAFQSLQN